MGSRIAKRLLDGGRRVVVWNRTPGKAAELVANSTLFGMLVALGEALALADRLGLDRDTAFEVLAHTPLAAQAERRRDSLATGSYPRRFALSLARKDASLVVEAGAAAGA